MLLSDADIKRYILIDEIKITGNYSIQQCSVDICCSGNHVLKPGDFLLVKTHNLVSLSNRIAGNIGGRSSYARKGLLVHATSAMINPGFSGHIVLELKNIGNETIVISDMEMIASISFFLLLTPCENLYNGKYQGQC